MKHTLIALAIVLFSPPLIAQRSIDEVIDAHATIDQAISTRLDVNTVVDRATRRRNKKRLTLVVSTDACANLALTNHGVQHMGGKIESVTIDGKEFNVSSDQGNIGLGFFNHNPETQNASGAVKGLVSSAFNQAQVELDLSSEDHEFLKQIKTTGNVFTVSLTPALVQRLGLTEENLQDEWTLTLATLNGIKVKVKTTYVSVGELQTEIIGHEL